MDDYSPRFVGDTAIDLRHTFVNGQGKAHDLSGVDPTQITFRIRPDGGVGRDGAGSWVMVDASEGQVAYQWAAADVAQAGIVDIQSSVPLDGKPLHFEIKRLVFLEPL